MKDIDKIREFIRQAVQEVLSEFEELDEMNVTGNVAGYNTPFAFKRDKKQKKIRDDQ